MNIAGIIAEYNPFHLGHAYHIRAAREQACAEGVICVMSGSFVQRGEPALVDKYRRTRAALAGGADLVLELAPAYAAGSAELFARGAVKTLAAAGCVNKLCFGVETEEPALLKDCAEVLLSDSALQKAVRERLREGLAYPKAMAAALDFLYPELGMLLRSPNNLLGVEYIKAIRSLGLESRIEPVPVRRQGQAFRDENLREDAEDTQASYASAAALRRALRNGKRAEELSAYMPEETVRQLDYVLTADSLSAALSAKLLTLDYAGEDLSSYEDVSPELMRRIRALRPYDRSFTALAEAVSAKAFSLARVRRALLHIFLDIRRGEGAADPTCLKLLGLRAGSPVPALLKKEALLPVITKTADDTAGLSASFSYSADLYNGLVRAAGGPGLPGDLRRSPVILP